MSIGHSQRRKRSRRELLAQADLAQTVLRTLTAILIDRDAPLLVRRECMALASGLRVDAQVQGNGDTLLTLQDQDGTTLPSFAPSVAEAVPA